MNLANTMTCKHIGHFFHLSEEQFGCLTRGKWVLSE